MPEDNLLRYTVDQPRAGYHVADTECGTMYGAYREAEAGKTYWRFANFMLPFWTQTPQGKFTEQLHARAWVPMDDNHTMFDHPGAGGRRPPAIGRSRTASRMPGLQRASRLPAEHDRLVRPLAARGADAENDWLIDREAQRNGGIYTGIDGIHAQDQAVTESMGPITDHAFEHLAPSDRMIARTRRRLLKAARALATTARRRPGSTTPRSCGRAQRLVLHAR